MLVIAKLALVILQLTNGAIHTKVDARIQVLLITAGDERLMVFNVGDDFRSVAIFGLVDDNIDLLNAIEETTELFDLFGGIALYRRGNFHVLAADFDLHSKLHFHRWQERQFNQEWAIGRGM